MNNIIHKLQTASQKWLNSYVYSVQVGCVALSIIFCIPESTYAATLLSKPANNLGLVGYWSFDEGTSTKAVDFSGNGYTGTLTNFASPMTSTSGWTQNGKLGSAINFAGDNDVLTTASHPVLGSTFTISSWIKPTNLSGFYSIIAVFDGAGWAFRTSSTGALSFYNGGTNYAAATSLSTGVWQHGVVTYDGNLYKMYVNGVLVYTSSAGQSAPTDRTNMYIGGNASNGYFPGGIDDVRVYNRSLSPREVLMLYGLGTQTINASRNVTGGTLDSGLVGLWSFDGKDISGTTAFDRSGLGNNGTITNGPVSTLGKAGQALKYDGVNDYTGAQYDLARASSSISVWIKTTTKDEGISQWSSFGYTYNGFTDRVLSLNSSGQARLYVYNGGACSAATLYIAGGADLTDNNWHHITGVWGPSGKYLYVDGVLVANNTDGIQSSTGSMPYLTIGEGDPGCSNSPAHPYFNGSIDDVRVYNRSLSPREVLMLYGLGTQTINASRNVTGGTLDSGLVGLWSFDGKDMNSTTAYDRSGSGNNGTLTNSPTPTIGKMGQALTFNESNTYVNVSDAASLQVTSQFSLSAWVYFTGNSANIDTVFMKNNANTNYYGMYLSGNRAFFYNPSITIATTPSYSTANKWTHVVITFDSTLPSNNAKIYLNGAFDNAVTKTTAFGSSVGGTLSIGRDPVNGRYFGGKIDDVRIYNRALSADEVKLLYNFGK